MVTSQGSIFCFDEIYLTKYTIRIIIDISIIDVLSIDVSNKWR